MKLFRILCLCWLLLCAGGSFVCAQNTPEEDGFLQLLRTELKLQYDSLQHTNHPPYFMAYRVKETTDFSISSQASFALLSRSRFSETAPR